MIILVTTRYIATGLGGLGGLTKPGGSLLPAATTSTKTYKDLEDTLNKVWLE